MILFLLVYFFIISLLSNFDALEYIWAQLALIYLSLLKIYKIIEVLIFHINYPCEFLTQIAQFFH